VNGRSPFSLMLLAALWPFILFRRIYNLIYCQLPVFCGYCECYFLVNRSAVLLILQYSSETGAGTRSAYGSMDPL